MPIYEYCQVKLKTEWDDSLKQMVIEGPVVAMTCDDIIAEGQTFLQVFNEIGKEGWRFVQTIQPEREARTYHYFEREIN